MGMQKIVALIFVLVGVMGLAYGGFTYTSDVHKADLGPLHLSIAEKEHVNIPVWAGLTLIVLGGALLVGRKKF
jgi:LPXTG-motif cell wall-anchored protein